MMNEKTMRAGLIAAAVFILVGMLFVPAVAAAYDANDPHYGGMPTNKSVTGSPDQIAAIYNTETKTLYFENASASGAAIIPAAPLDLATLFPGITAVDADVALIDVDTTISLENNANLFSKFTNAKLNYLGDKAAVDLFGSKKIYSVNATNSTVQVNKSVTDTTKVWTGEALTIDTNWATAGQQVKIAVRPLQNYSVYGWEVYQGTTITGTPLAESAYTIVKSTDPEDGATTYILTMPAFDVTVSPMLRDSGSTIVTYVFLDAETYLLEIPADFSLKGLGNAKASDGKMVNLTACDIDATAHHLQVTMDSTNGKFTDEGNLMNPTGDYTTASDLKIATISYMFALKNVRNPSAFGAYTIGAKKLYADEASFGNVQDEAVVLDTKDVKSSDPLISPGTDEAIIEKLGEGNLKTELKFTLVGVNKANLGKYKDKLTFTVGIINK